MSATIERALVAAWFAIALLGGARPASADGMVPGAGTQRAWAPMYRAESVETDAARQAPVVAPLLELGAAPALEAGRGVMVASVISPTLTIRTWGGWRLGGSFTPVLGQLQSFEGCTPVKFCLQSSWRAAARAEYQVYNQGSARPWAAVELGLESWTGADMLDNARRVSGITPVVSAQGGIDAVTRGTSGLAGVGVFGGLVLGHQGMGLQLGVRVAFGAF